MNENERKLGHTGQGFEALANRAQKTVEKAKSPLRIVGILTTPLKNIDPLRVESPLRKLVESSPLGNFAFVDDTMLELNENMKNVDFSTFRQIENSKKFEMSTLKNNDYVKNVEISATKQADFSDPKNAESFKKADISTLKQSENLKNVDFSTLKNAETTKKVAISTLKNNEVPKSVENSSSIAFEKPTLKALVTRKLLEYTKLPGTFDKHPLINNEARLKGDALLKSLLSASTALSQKMITTTEVTDENLNLRKILYQADKAKCDEKDFDSPLPSGNPNDSLNDEDDRLVIDIPDEINSKVSKKSMPSLESFEDENKNVSKLLRPSTLDTTFASTRPLMRQPTAAQDSECIPQ